MAVLPERLPSVFLEQEGFLDGEFYSTVVNDRIEELLSRETRFQALYPDHCVNRVVCLLIYDLEFAWQGLGCRRLCCTRYEDRYLLDKRALTRLLVQQEIACYWPWLQYSFTQQDFILWLLLEPFSQSPRFVVNKWLLRRGEELSRVLSFGDSSVDCEVFGGARTGPGVIKNPYQCDRDIFYAYFAIIDHREFASYRSRLPRRFMLWAVNKGDYYYLPPPSRV